MLNLSYKRETYCQQRTNGLSRAESYRIAYPKSVKWSLDTLYARASELEKRPEIQARINELRKPHQNLLTNYRNEIIQTAIDTALGKNKKKIDTTILNKLLDKLLPSKTENKNEVSHTFNIVFDI